VQTLISDRAIAVLDDLTLHATDDLVA